MKRKTNFARLVWRCIQMFCAFFIVAVGLITLSNIVIGEEKTGYSTLQHLSIFVAFLVFIAAFYGLSRLVMKFAIAVAESRVR